MFSIRCLILLLLGASVFSSCTKQLVPFTESMTRANKWEETDLKKIQYYLSEDILLHRQVNEVSSTITNGEIKMVNGRQIEEVTIPRGTPGVLIYTPKKDHFAISFESANDSSYLTFGPNPNISGRYVLLASDWKKRIGQVHYNGQKYYTNSESAASFLLVDMKKINKSSVKRRVAKGRKLEE